MQVLRSGDRAFAGKAVAAQTGMSEEAFGDLKRHVRFAAFRGGVPAMHAAGWNPEEGLLRGPAGNGARPSRMEEGGVGEALEGQEEAQATTNAVPADLSVGASCRIFVLA